jgi:hypothetical protein
MLWFEDHIQTPFPKNPMGKLWEVLLYLLKNSCGENKRYGMEYILNITFKTLVEKLGDMRYVLVLIFPY